MSKNQESYEGAPFLSVELVGPAGSGKSTIISVLRESHAAEFGYIGRPRPTIAQRLIAAFEALPTVLSPRVLSLRERRRLFQAHRGIRAAARWIKTLPPGVHVIDEGPHRVIHDRACQSNRQLEVWRSIVSSELKQLAALPTLVIHVQAAPDQRRERRQERMGPLELRDPNFNRTLPHRKRNLLFIRDELGPLSPPDSAFTSIVEVRNTTTVEAAVATIRDQIGDKGNPRRMANHVNEIQG